MKNALICKFCPLKVRFGALLSSSKTGEESFLGLSMYGKGCFIGVFHSYVTTKSAQSSFLDIKFCQNNKETVFSSCLASFYVTQHVLHAPDAVSPLFLRPYLSDLGSKIVKTTFIYEITGIA